MSEHAGPLKWIESTGGPFVVVPASRVQQWLGVQGDDYDRACQVDDYLGQVPMDHAQSAVVVADEPLTMTFLPQISCLLQWLYAPSEEALAEAAVREFQHLQGWHTGPTIRIDEQLTAFDSTLSGDSLQEQDFLAIPLPPGNYFLATGDFVQGEEISGRLHRIIPQSSTPAG